MARGPRTVTDGPRPKHAQLTDLLADEVAERLRPGDPIASERELVDRHGVSRATVRKAIEALVTRGVLHRVPGKGTFVARPRVESRLHLASFTQDMRRRGLTPTTRLVRLSLEQPGGRLARSLALTGTGRAARAWRVERVRLADGIPMALEVGWYPQATFADLDRHDLRGSLYALFADHYRVVVDSAEQTLWGESAEGEVASALRAPAHAPLLVFERRSFSAGRAVEHVVSHYRGDRYQVRMTLGPPEPHDPSDPSTLSERTT